MKNYVVVLLFFLALPVWVQGQKENKESGQKRWKLELLYTQDILNTSYGKNYGYIFKGKLKCLDSKHFTLSYGAAHQNSYIAETDNLFTDYVEGYTRDIGLYSIFDVTYYPFNKKKFYLSLEPFIGATHLKSKGTLKIPQYSVYEKYKNEYVYFNYGVSQSLGYNINNFSVSAFAWVSLKGFLDKGRNRPADFDSRFFLGLGLGYTL
ncbi:hypothetical protein [Aquimarina megaterium]|uniref:hypothetical protein n=1 Tax=Aquimarina megaterium TaxID=1443666 RepID=UPI0009443355|nr:hypothetical protein [Aquimarina megaterium]